MPKRAHGRGGRAGLRRTAYDARPISQVRLLPVATGRRRSYEVGGVSAGRGGDPLVHVLVRRDEAVANVAHRADERLVVRAELRAQPADVDVHRAGAAEVVV